VQPYRLRAGDTVKVTCRHVQWLRDRLPAFEGQPDRYVVWGEGTTDEMCLGILQVTRS
jgi:protein involved in polysaccharide export with SLBB domain